MTGPRVDVVAESPLWAAVPGAARLARRAAGAGLAAAAVAVSPKAEIGVLLTDDAAIRELNRAWRGFDKPTNVLSFPAASPGALAGAPHLGDVALAFETIRAEAAAEGKALADHFAHLVVHGVLHLLGHDHGAKRGAEAMERLEAQALAAIGIADPYAEAPGPAGGALTEH